MRILVISHAYAERANHKKLEVFSSFPNLEVGLIFPRIWRTWHGEDKEVQKSKIKKQKSYCEFPIDTYFSGDGGKYLYKPIQLIGSIISFKPDVVYVEEEPFSFVSCQLSAVSWLLRTKLVFFTWENLDLPLGKLRDFIEKFTFMTAHSAVAGNVEVVERLKKRGFQKLVEVIPQFGVDTELFHEIPSLSSERPEKVFTVGFVGRPSMAKGVDVLMKAVSLLPFEYQLLIVTSSRDVPQEFLDLAYSLGISERVKYKTSVPHTELPIYFYQMDVFVLPSRTTKTWKEQFGRTLIEAMACGVPVVGSSSGAIPEVIGKAGLVFNEGDHDDLRRKLEISSETQQKEKLIVSGLKRVTEHYTYSKICQNLYEFLSR